MFAKNLISHPFPFRLSMAIMAILLIGSAAAPTDVRDIVIGTIISVNTISDTATDDTVCSLHEAIANADANGAIYGDCGGGSGDDLIIFDC